MKVFKVEGISGEALAKRMLKLAWDASRTVGLGFLQDRGPGLSEDDLWKRGCDNMGRTGGGRVSTDYLFGRMMKLRFEYNEEGIVIGTDVWRPDYQSFCTKYRNLEFLAESAAASFKVITEKAS
jgi:hypothetical protein